MSTSKAGWKSSTASTQWPMGSCAKGWISSLWPPQYKSQDRSNEKNKVEEMCVAYYHLPQTGVRYKYENTQPFDDISSFQGCKEKPYLFQLLHMVREWKGDWGKSKHLWIYNLMLWMRLGNLDRVVQNYLNWNWNFLKAKTKMKPMNLTMYPVGGTMTEKSYSKCL